jgi:nucleoside-diphosphate-sugar epimerase
MRVKDGGKFLFLSSSEVYSGSTNLPFVESDIGITNTTHPRAPYIEGKKIGECIVNAVREERRIDAVSVRLSQAYGPGSKLGDKRFMNNFIASALTKNEIKLMDSGDSYRNYCYISDAVEMILAIMLCGDAPIYNVGGISKASILDIAKMISSITNSTVEKGPKEVNPDGAPQMVEVDLSLFNSIHKKTNYVSLREGIYRTVEWQKQYIFNKLS